MVCAEWLQDPHALGIALDGMRMYHMFRGEYDQIIVCAQKAADWYRKAGDLFEWGQVHNGVAVSLSYQGNMTQAIPYLEEEIRVAKEAGIPNLHTMALSTLGFAYLRLGQFDKAIAVLQECLQVSRANTFTFNIVSGGGTLVLCYLRTGQREQALALLQELYPIYRKNPALWGGQIPLLWGRAEYYLGSAEQANGPERARWLKLARPACTEAIQNSQRFRPGMPGSMRLRGVYEWLAGKPAAAQKWWQRSLTLAEEMGQRYDLGLAHLEMGQRLGECAHLECAEAIFTEIGAEWDLARVRKASGKLQAV